MRRTTPASLFTHIAQWFGPGIQVRHRLDGAPWATMWCAPRPRAPRPHAIIDELSRRVTTRRRAAIYAAQRGRWNSSGTLGIAVEGLLIHDTDPATRSILLANGYTARQVRQLLRMARKQRARGTH